MLSFGTKRTKLQSRVPKRYSATLPHYVWVPVLLIVFLSLLIAWFEKYPLDVSEKKPVTVGSVFSFTTNGLKHMFRHQLVYAAFADLSQWFWWMLPTWRIPMPTGQIDSRLPPVPELRHDAYRAFQLIEQLREHKFFRIFKIDLAKECPFWARREMCTSPGACQICECDDEQIPPPWKLKPIKNFVDRNHYNSSKIEPWGEDDTFDASAYDKIWTVPYPETPILRSNGLVSSVSDEGSKSASYVDLTLNRPGFTAYRGRNIWRLIYQENCMGSMNNPLENVGTAHAFTRCTEEEAFHKIVSGMQTAIMVLSSEYHHSKNTPAEHQKEIEEYKKKGRVMNTAAFRAQYSPDLKLFRERVATERAWLENLYFTFGVLLRTLCRVAPVLDTCDCDTGTRDDDARAKNDLRALVREPFAACREAYVNEPLFHRKQQLALKQFHNISRIMDCLECEKCRLHGKVKIVALQLALRASGNDTRVHWVERNEVIALVNSIGYFADSIMILDKFRGRLLLLRVCGALGVTIVLSIAASGCRVACRQRLNSGYRAESVGATNITDDEEEDHSSSETVSSMSAEYNKTPIRQKRVGVAVKNIKRRKNSS